MTAKADKVPDYDAMKPLVVDCRRCPFPSERNRDLCSVCATKVVDGDGKVYVSPRPVKAYLGDAPRSRRKTARPKTKRRKKW